MHHCPNIVLKKFCLKCIVTGLLLLQCCQPHWQIYCKKMFIKIFLVFRNICFIPKQLLLLSINVFFFLPCVLSYKFTLDELYSMKASVTQRAESYKNWLINVQEILENKGSKKKG